MRKYILQIFFLILSVNLYSSDWKFIKQLNDGDFRTLDCSDSNNCFALQQQTGYIILYNSTDKGKTWSKTYESDPMNTEPLYLLNAHECVSPNPDYYYVIFWEGCNVTKSSDGGKTFKKIKLSDSSHPYSIVMKDKDKGIILSEIETTTWFFVTNDGWETFRKLDTNIEGAMWNVGEFTDEYDIQMDYSSKIDTPIPHTYVITHQYINYNFKSNEWKVLSTFFIDSNFVDTSKVYYGGFSGMDNINDSVAFLAGYRGTGVAQYNSDLIYRTKDGGKTWEKVLDSIYEPKWGLQQIAFYDEKNGVAVGQHGKILTTNDGGDTWVYNILPQKLIDESPLTMKVTWAGQTPIIGTWDGNIYRYEGNFFKVVKEPDRINLISPTYNLNKLSGKVEFNWSDNNSNKYYLQISKNFSFTNIIYDTTATSNTIVIPNLESFTTYYWRVGFKYNKKLIWSDYYVFNTKLYPSITISPDCGSISQNVNPTLEWTKENGADYVRLEYAKSPDFMENRILIDSILINSTTIKNLDSGTTYYWHVQAYNYAEESDWSETCSFTTNKATSINYESGNPDLVIYPNPVNDKINFKNDEFLGSNYKIYDILSQQLQTGVITNNIVNIEKLQTGIYFINIDKNNKTIFYKFIKD